MKGARSRSASFVVSGTLERFRDLDWACGLPTPSLWPTGARSKLSVQVRTKGRRPEATLAAIACASAVQAAPAGLIVPPTASEIDVLLDAVLMPALLRLHRERSN